MMSFSESGIKLKNVHRAFKFGFHMAQELLLPHKVSLSYFVSPC